MIISINSKEKHLIFIIHLKLKTKILDKSKIEENFLNSINYTYQKITVNIKLKGETSEIEEWSIFIQNNKGRFQNISLINKSWIYKTHSHTILWFSTGTYTDRYIHRNKSGRKHISLITSEESGKDQDCWNHRLQGVVIGDFLALSTMFLFVKRRMLFSWIT